MLKVDETGFVPNKQMIKYQNKIMHAIFETYKGDEAEEIFEALLEMEEAWTFARYRAEKQLREKKGE